MADPYLILGPDGSKLHFNGGQPIMDEGLENLAFISLFTSKGWCGNSFLSTQIGSDFEKACNQPITRRALNEIRNAAEIALTNKAFGKVTVTVANPVSHRLVITARIERTGQILQFVRNRMNWGFQTNDPAHLKPLNDRLPPQYVTLQGEFATLTLEDAIW